MFNSSVLDVAIGLIFVYLLLGLMCTTVNEWFAQLFKTRAATLKEGIRRLLQAPPDGTYLIRPVDINVASLAKRFNKPDDKLTQAIGPFDADLQSRLDQFVKALNEGPSAQPPADLATAMADKLSAALSNPALVQTIDTGKVTPETKAEIAKQPKGNDLLRVNRKLLSEAYPDEITSLSDAFYNHPLIKSLARPGKHPSYVPSKTFALTLLDIFAKGQAATGTAEQRLAQIKASIDNLPDSDVKKSLQALLMNGSDSVEKVEQKLEGWFSDSMDRVSGWYKNRVQVWTVIIASLITILVNADTIQIAQKLMINPALRDKIVADAKDRERFHRGSNSANADGAAKRRPQQFDRLDPGVPHLSPSGRVCGSQPARRRPSRSGLQGRIRPAGKSQPQSEVRRSLEQRFVSRHDPVQRDCVSVALGCGSNPSGGLDSNRDRRFSWRAVLV